ncbi:Uncharacterised protein [Mycobacterium tuberculosis]|nr:Uncharacterised protein [Mycobacterium tuberculosis]COX23005.1 Uncharacterised protein [Mycobacterium tuberculosis]
MSCAMNPPLAVYTMSGNPEMGSIRSTLWPSRR